MSSVALSATSDVAERSTIRTLAWVEAKRYARHPLFLVGLALGILASAGERGPIELDYHVIPSFFVGVLGLLVASRLTTSTDRSQPVLDAAPVSETTRTAALCLACAIPAAAGVVLVLLHRAFVMADPFPSSMYGTYGSTDRFFITIVVPVIACAGAPLLGVAVGRWLRFPGASLLAMITVLLWSAVAAYVPAQNMDGQSLFARILHMTTPYTAFASSDADSATSATTTVTSYTGSPVWFAVWTLCLCGLAATAALWRGADRRQRGVVGRVFVVVSVLALVSLTLSVPTGNQKLYDTTPSGTSVSSSQTDG